ncbi:hypothetical protein Y032_0087g2113 [Ancylostoma ceylanicum]|uniref:Uncharacterized protein n=1 Tax=Ancylostoma ceylanicum TaxID=53326 RepID=A0A016TNP6_9BILA|nr:hypothetical protein Y032_0087g2113 [Ancylostoma ceylanicum]
MLLQVVFKLANDKRRPDCTKEGGKRKQGGAGTSRATDQERGRSIARRRSKDRGPLHRETLAFATPKRPVITTYSIPLYIYACLYYVPGSVLSSIRVSIVSSDVLRIKLSRCKSCTCNFILIYVNGDGPVLDCTLPMSRIKYVRIVCTVQRLRADCQKPLARSFSTEDLKGWNGSARTRMCNATSTPRRMPCIMHSVTVLLKKIDGLRVCTIAAGPE